MLELTICYVNTHSYLVSESMPLSTKTPSILLMWAFFCKKSGFFDENSTFTQSINIRAVLENF